MSDKDLINFEEFKKNGDPFETPKVQRDLISEYLSILRVNIIPILLILVVSVVVTFLFLRKSINVYRATTVMQIEPPQGNILQSSFGDVEISKDERYIANQIEVLRSYIIRDLVAGALLDSMKHRDDLKYFNYLVLKSENAEITIPSKEYLRKRLLGLVGASQKKGLDAVDISVEGPYFHEAQLITFTYANVYLNYNLELSREDIQNVKNYLNSEKEKKQKELNDAEASLEDFQKRTGIIQLDEQTTNLVRTISDYDVEKNTAEIELKANQQRINVLTNEYDKIDSNFVDYVDAKLNSSLLSQIQNEIAKIEVARDVDIASTNDERVKEKIRADANKKIAGLQSQLDQQVDIFKKGLDSDTPEDQKGVYDRLVDAKIDARRLSSRIGSLGGVLNFYEGKFSQLPSQSIELAKLQRTRNSTEKLFLTLEEKYQEATINERSRLGNVSILDPGFDNYGPVAPDRPRIMLFGAITGLILGIAFAFLRNYFDKTIKSPDEIEDKGGSLLSWIPNIENMNANTGIESEFVVYLRPTSAVSESFKALRTRIQFSKLQSRPLQTILVTSSIPSEGKTLVSVNLAGSFAQAGKKVLLLDCDLRKPKVHTFFKEERYPGLSDYLFNNVTFEEIVRETALEGMYFITSGTIPPNPSELLGSLQMKKFLDFLRDKYDYIVIDSPPLITVTDSEILFNITDGTVLIAQANKTPTETFWKTYQTLYNRNPHNLLGCVLNNFSFKSSYGYYYNYYYYYSRPEERAKK
ncbi:MAG: polysaccharide biosynthesis tyrosine autokinase [Ignavibacteriae bacterium]|nr:polysaccharide biosynthesis tyrosine autokinase [Ignavibacteriota bacterium]